jgi:hypothetical protein
MGNAWDAQIQGQAAQLEMPEIKFLKGTYYLYTFM